MAAAVTETPRRIANRERLIFALDVPDLAGAKDLVSKLGDSVVFYKIGLELATSRHYFELLDWLIGRDKKVFTDLKLYDIPATVTAAVRQLARSGAAFLTVHGDRAVAEAAAQAKGGELKILAVTVLTSVAPSDLAEMGIALTARRARAEARSPGRRSRLRRRDRFRPRGRAAARGIGQRAADRDARHPAGRRRSCRDQRRVVTPTLALRSGADHIVVGRPIRDAADPYRAASAIQEEIAGVFG